MRISRIQAAENRQKIVDVASRLFREGGIHATGVDAVMKAAGMTHGGFYGHFQSKDTLVAEACGKSISQSVEKWENISGHENPLNALINHYLSVEHRDHPGSGCLIAALAAEASRSGPEVRKVMTEGIKSLVGVIETNTPGRKGKAKRNKALGSLAAMVGAVVIARAVDDPELSAEILAATAKALTSAVP